MFRAIEAHLAWGGIQRYNAHSFLESADILANFLDHSSQFVSEEGWWHNHASMIAALINFQIGAAGQRDLHFDQHFSLANAGDGHPFNFHVLFAVEDSCRHLS